MIQCSSDATDHTVHGMDLNPFHSIVSTKAFHVEILPYINHSIG